MRDAINLESLASKRYEVQAEIGRGATGVVYRAYDTTAERLVALKALHSLEPDGVFRLKKEFRSLSELSHRNLVQLYDLSVSDQHCFFTMELINGVDLLAHLRGTPTKEVDEATDARPASNHAALRAAFGQLAVALDAFHAVGKIHRDIKPSNVLVDGSGRVVLLDFGFASALSSRASRDSREGSFVGTFAYMSPEQAQGGQISESSDWYSVGVMLYESLTGNLPFSERGLLSLSERTSRVPPPAKELFGEVPTDLSDLASQLLSIDPEQRPTASRIARWLGYSEQQKSDGRFPRELFVGRSAEIGILHEAERSCRGSLRTVCVTGESGLGKTTLVERFLGDIADRRDVLILTARCYPQEAIAFKAIDGIIDALTRYLLKQPKSQLETLLPRRVTALLKMFPVLARVPGVLAASGADTSGTEPRELRRRGSNALVELLARIANHTRLVLWIDDLQWGDLDSAALLRDLRGHADPPSALLLLSYRPPISDRAEPIHSALGTAECGDAAERPLRIALGPMPTHELLALAAEIVPARLHGGPDRTLETIAAEGDGSPFLTAELAQHVALHSERLRASGEIGASFLYERVALLAELPRRLLEIVAASGEPIDERALRWLGGREGDMDTALAHLRNERLTRSVLVNQVPAVGAYHDRIRETVIEQIPPELQVAIHEQIAEALERLPDTDPQLLVHRYRLARKHEKASQLAIESADRAFEALAFNAAAELYGIALDLSNDRRPTWRLESRLAESLANIGRVPEAAEHYRIAAERLSAINPDDDEVQRIKRLSAEQYLRTGLYEQGLEVLHEVLAASQLRYWGSPTLALLSLLWNRARLNMRRPRPASSVLRPEDHVRLESCWTAGLGLGVFDILRAADFQVRHSRLAHKTGSSSHLARALAIEALLMDWEGGSSKRDRAGGLRVEAERLARVSEEPNVQAYSMVVRAVGAFVQRRLRDALSLARAGEDLCRERCIGAAWELANVQVIEVSALALMGEFRIARARLTEMLRDAHDRGDELCLLMGRLGIPNSIWLAADQSDTARHQAKLALSGPFPTTFTWPTYQGAVAETQIDLYGQAGRAGLARATTAWPLLRSGQMLRLQPVRVEMRDLQARCALRVAVDSSLDGAERNRMLRLCARQARKIAREDAPWVSPLANSLFGGIAAARGELAESEERLERAALAFEEVLMLGHADAARFQLGAVLGSRGTQVREEAAQRMRDRGVADPARFSEMLIPLRPHA